jgi:signal transduction histidine kinase/ligand-binding sensor domain-containing protein
MQRGLFILACFFICVNCFPQSAGSGGQYAFVHYTSKDGLVNNRTRFIFQDSKGLLYISTFGGLSVYDGARFTNYSTDNGLATSLVNDILEMGYDSLWLIPNANKIQCMIHGVIKDLPTSDGFCPVINHLIKFSDGFYYAMADEGFYRFENNHFKKIRLGDEKNEAVNLILAEEFNGLVFIVTDPNTQTFPSAGGLIVFDLKTHKVLIGKDLPKVLSILTTPLNEILVSTDSGIFKIDKKALAQGKISFSGDVKAYGIPSDVRAINMFFDHQKNLWLLNSSGVLKIEKDGGAKNFNTGNGLSGNNPVSVFQDKENTIWLSFENNGINKLVNQRLQMNLQPVKNFLVSHFSIDPVTNLIWMLDGRKNDLLQLHNGHPILYHSKSKSPLLTIFCYANQVYFFNDNQIFKAYFSGNSFTPVIIFREDSSTHGISDMWSDKNENLIVVSDKITVLTNGKKIVSVPLGYLSDQVCLNGDLLWAVTRRAKLFLYRIHPDKPENYLEPLAVYEKQLELFSPRSIVADKQNRVWIGSRDHGLFCFQYSNGELKLLKQLTTKDGLSENFINYLHCDSNNNIWACSPAGLDKISNTNERFSVENVTKSNNFFQPVSYTGTDKNGIHWAISSGGLIRIDPETRIVSSYVPKLLFTEVIAANKKIADLQKKISLNYSENTVSFRVAAPSFLDEKLVRYTYLLEGSGNSNWTEPSQQSEINFAGLAPGHYTLKVKAEFLNGTYPEQGSSFAFTILPPWWQTWWFRIAAGIIFIGLLFAGLRFYYRRKLEKQQLILEKQQAIEQERSRIAADMHDDLGAGLTKIKFLTEDVLEKTDSGEEVKPQLEKLRNFSTELVESMGEIIWAVSEKNNLLSDTLYYLRSYSVNYCEENNIDCHFEMVADFKDRIVSGNIRRNIFLLLKESLHNIVKHADAKTITIKAVVSDKLELVIKDDGKGFSNNGNDKGNGLINMKKRVKELNGFIGFENNGGATVIIQLPFP